MKKQIIKEVTKTVSFCLVFMLLFLFFNSFLKISESTTIASVEGFYKEEENSLDVVVLGASEVYADYSATMAWEKFGYTSYSLSVSGVPGSLYKSMLRETMEKQNPKLVVIEINGFMQKDDYYERTMQLHSWIDSIQNEENRQLTIQEAIPKDQQDDFNKTFSFDINHNNWKMIGKCASTYYTTLGMKFKDHSVLKGYASFAKHSDPEEALKDRKLYFTDKSKDYLTDLLEYCKECGVENVMFARFPHEKAIKNPEKLDEVKSMVNSYGYEFVNFEELKDDIGLTQHVDYYNPEHMNVNGCEKFTTYIGEYITANYDVYGEHSEELKAQWDEDAWKASEFFDILKTKTRREQGWLNYELSL